MINISGHRLSALHALLFGIVSVVSVARMLAWWQVALTASTLGVVA